MKAPARITHHPAAPSEQPVEVDACWMSRHKEPQQTTNAVPVENFAEDASTAIGVMAKTSRVWRGSERRPASSTVGPYCST